MSVCRSARKLLQLSSSLCRLGYACAGGKSESDGARQFGSGETVVGSVASAVDDGFEVASHNRTEKSGNILLETLWRVAQ